MIKKLFLTILVLLISLLPCLVAASGDYNYNSRQEAVPCPKAYELERIILPGQEGLSPFDVPEDIFVDEAKNIYVADTGNSRIVIFDEKWNVIGDIGEFISSGMQDRLSGPKGVYVTDKGDIYIADTGNNRIVQFSEKYEFVRMIETPESEILRKEFIFLPEKVILDKGGNIYAVGPGMYEGILKFDSNGNFVQFAGSNMVEPNWIEYFWKRIFATKAQQEQTSIFIPEEFNNLDMDSEGFIFATSAISFVKRLNNQGADITRINSDLPPVGDHIDMTDLAVDAKDSRFIDVSVDRDSIYSVLDSTRNRIFTYDQEGNLLYVFGGEGDHTDLFREPVSIDTIGDRILVLDKSLGRISVFKPTEYGNLIRSATLLHYNGKYEMASKTWMNILKHNANLEIAYTGIGRTYLMNRQYKDALDAFRNANNKHFYGKALKQYRRELMKEYFGIIMSVVVLIAVAGFVLKIFRAVRRRKHAA